MNYRAYPILLWATSGVQLKVATYRKSDRNQLNSYAVDGILPLVFMNGRHLATGFPAKRLNRPYMASEGCRCVIDNRKCAKARI